MAHRTQRIRVFFRAQTLALEGKCMSVDTPIEGEWDV